MLPWRSVLLPLALLVSACGPDLGEVKTPRNLPHLAGFESRLKDMRGEDGVWVRGYLDGETSLSREVDERRLSGVLGRLVHADRPDVVAGLVEKARKHLYVEFFYAFTDAERRALVKALRDMVGDGSVRSERYAAVLGAPSVGFPATLDLVLQSLRLSEIARPSEMLPQRVVDVARKSTRPEVETGAAEVLMAEGWVRLDGGEQDRRASMAAARNLLTEAVKKKSDDPAIRMAYVLLHLRADITRAELQQMCMAGGQAEPENGAYPYLRALTLAQAGHDDEAITAIREGMALPYVSFHDVERARCVAAFLDEAGLGPVGAKLAASGAASVDGPQGMRRLSQLLRECPEAGRGSPAIVVAFPRRLAEQLAQRPRLLSTEIIRLKLALGSWEWSLGQDPDEDGARAIREEHEALEKGMRIASGPQVWDRMSDLLGEKGFMRYVDEVLFGGEAEFLRECAGKKDLEACVEMLK